jgi:hypothetical protein
MIGEHCVHAARIYHNMWTDTYTCQECVSISAYECVIISAKYNVVLVLITIEY